MFMNTLGISNSKVKTLRSKLFNDTLSFAESLKHGLRNRSAHNKLPDTVIDAIHTHIQRFSTVPSHYFRKDSQRHFFEKGLNKKKRCWTYTMTFQMLPKYHPLHTILF